MCDSVPHQLTTSGDPDLGDGWKLLYSGVESTQAGGVFLLPQRTGCVDEWISLGVRVCMLKVIDCSLYFIQVYTGPSSTAQYQEFMEETNDALQRVEGNEATILLAYFTHWCRSQQFLGGAKVILPEFPKFTRKTCMRQTFSLQILCNFWYIIFNSTILPCRAGLSKCGARLEAHLRGPI